MADVGYTLTCIPEVARRSRYVAIIESHWKQEYGIHGKDIAKGWARGAVATLKPCQTVSMKYPADEAIHDSYPDFGFSDEIYHRLQSIKATYDPGNMFRSNLNILPMIPTTDD